MSAHSVMSTLIRCYPGDRCLDFLLTVAFGVALASIAAWFVARRLGRRAALRHLVLFSALICCLVLPLMDWFCAPRGADARLGLPFSTDSRISEEARWPPGLHRLQPIHCRFAFRHDNQQIRLPMTVRQYRMRRGRSANGDWYDFRRRGRRGSVPVPFTLHVVRVGGIDSVRRRRAVRERPGGTGPIASRNCHGSNGNLGGRRVAAVVAPGLELRPRFATSPVVSSRTGRLSP